MWFQSCLDEYSNKNTKRGKLIMKKRKNGKEREDYSRRSNFLSLGCDNSREVISSPSSIIMYRY